MSFRPKDVEASANRIIQCLTEDGMIRPGAAMDALLAATATTILMFSQDDSIAFAEKFGEVLIRTAERGAADFPTALKASVIQ